MNAKASPAVAVCALLIIAGLFLPWFSLFGAGMSGYELGKLGSYGNLAYVGPVIALLTLLQGYAGDNRLAGFFAGVGTLGSLAYVLNKAGAFKSRGPVDFGDILEAASHILNIGAYLTLGGAVVIILAAASPVTKAPAPAE